MTKPDHLSNEVSIAATLEDKGVAAKVRSRAIAAFDRLVGAAIDLPTSYLENASMKTRLRGEIERRLISTESDPSSNSDCAKQGAEKITDELIRRETRALANKKAIVESSIDHLTSADEIDESGDLEEDWLNHYDAAAEKASSERMRDLWGRVLAGEIRRPGTFSLGTLRFLSELDADIARLFQACVEHRLPNGMLLKPEDLRGQDLLDMIFLEEVGLLQEVHGFLGQDLNADEDGIVYYRYDNCLLVMKIKKPKLRIPLIRITRTGREISNILPQVDKRAALRKIAAQLNRHTEAAEIAIITGERDDGVEFSCIEKL